jgi:uncharacterized protein YrzB (UPF0473 family)
MAELHDENIFTLTDEEGKEQDFELLGSEVVDGTLYVALVPVGEESDVYVILKQTTDENGEDFLVTIEDDEEFDRVADVLEDKLFDEVDYDEK